MSSNSQSFSYSYYSSSTSTNGGPPHKATFAERSYTDQTGTTTERIHQLPGQQPVYESESSGARRVTAPAGNMRNRITDVTDVDNEYEGQMKDEHAKREGGA